MNIGVPRISMSALAGARLLGLGQWPGWLGGPGWERELYLLLDVKRQVEKSRNRKKKKLIQFTNHFSTYNKWEV